MDIATSKLKTLMKVSLRLALKQRCINRVFSSSKALLFLIIKSSFAFICLSNKEFSFFLVAPQRQVKELNG
jgi:hypothetical protein